MMQNSTHPVVTRDYPENMSNGIMICGINFGISKSEEQADQNGETATLEEKSFFADDSVRKTDDFNRRIVTWLKTWGILLTRTTGSETSFDKRFFQTNWLDSQTPNADVEGKADVLVENSAGILSLIQERKPAVILFFGKKLIEALNDTRAISTLEDRSVRQVAESILGSRSGNPQNHSPLRPDGSKQKYSISFQRYGSTQIISIPHPSRRTGVKDEDIKHLKPPLEILRKFQFDVTT